MEMKTMNRRELAKRLGMAGLATLPFVTRWNLEAATPAKPATGEAGPPNHDMSGYGIPQGPPQQIAMLSIPR